MPEGILFLATIFILKLEPGLLGGLVGLEALSPVGESGPLVV